MTVKVIFNLSCCSSLYIVFAALTVYRELDTVLVAAECIRIIINGVVVTVVVVFIYQLGSLSNSNLNFALTI